MTSKEQGELAYVEEIGAALPKGIKLQHDGRCRAMVSLRVKNCVCVGYDGRKLLRGGAVHSGQRGRPPRARKR